MTISSRLDRIEQELSYVMPIHINNDWLYHISGKPSQIHDLSQIDSFLNPGLDLLNRGGKRWRPLILVLCCEAAGGGDRGYKLTPLVEIPHNGSLIIDDIEDNSLERRGGPAIHIKYGIDTSINTGNFMYFLPTSVIENEEYSDSEKLSIYSGYLEDMRRLHIGQGLDILWHNNVEYIPNEIEYMQMCYYKTGSLSRMAARLGSLAARKDKEFIKTVSDIWESAGAGFQILDDVKNLTSGNPGKQRGDDILERKKSLPLILHCLSGQKEKEQLLNIIRSVVDKSPDSCREDIEKAIKMMEDSGSIINARDKGLFLLENCIKALKDLFDESEALDQQIEIIDTFINKMGLV